MHEARLFAHLALHTESNFFTGFSGDLSDGGVFVTTYEPLEVGQPVQLELCLLGGHFVTLEGTVVWLRDPPRGEAELSPGAGISLQIPDEHVRDLIRQFMGRREPTFVDPEMLNAERRMGA